MPPPPPPPPLLPPHLSQKKLATNKSTWNADNKTKGDLKKSQSATCSQLDVTKEALQAVKQKLKKTESSKNFNLEKTKSGSRDTQKMLVLSQKSAVAVIRKFIAKITK